MASYYNENDPYAAQWLRNLIAAGLIPAGDVDERSIVAVRPADLDGYTQCHFFAGLGGWPRALQLAGWAATRAVWTGSCPCQGESVAGKQLGKDDPRHLWPAWFPLIRQRRPAIVFGEQVARAAGTHWLDAVYADMEGIGYAIGTAVMPACAVGAPHRRDRLWFVAHSNSDARHEGRSRDTQEIEGGRDADRGSVGANARDSDSERLEVRQSERGNARAQQSASVGADWWAIEPDVGRVANGVSARVGKLRAIGNAIVPQVAAEFIKAVMQ